MKKILMVIVGVMCLAGCGLDQYGETEKKPMPKVSDPPPHVRTVWKQGSIEMDEIDGHLYLVGRISVGGYGSYGVCQIVHTPDCPCRKKGDQQ